MFDDALTALTTPFTLGDFDLAIVRMLFGDGSLWEGDVIALERTVIPEPAGLALLAAGLLGLGFARRRNRG